MISASELLGDRALAVPLRMPCPSCGARYARRRINGEIARVDTLKLTEAGCECAECRATWAPSEFHFLARLLGCESLPTA